jgi:putative ABC transport system permease protein
MLSALWSDARYAVRGYLRIPVFTTVAVATLALGIGSATAIFSVVQAVLLEPLPYPRSTELVAVAQVRRDSRAPLSLSPPNYFDVEAQSRVFSGIAAYGRPGVTIAGAGGDPEAILAATASPGLFSVLGISPVLGRGFTAGDATPGAPRIAVISYGLWQRRFAGDGGVLGHEVLIDNAPTVVVGVMPAAFDFPARGTDLWLPLQLSRTQPPNPGIPAAKYREYRILSVVARLRPGVSLATAQRETARIGDVLARDYPDANRELTIGITPLRDAFVRTSRPALLLLFAAVTCVLLIACANASSLILVRAATRTREIAIRRALGAGRGRLVRQMLAESVILAAAGGAAGLLLAAWIVELFVRFAPAGIPRLENVHVDAATAAFAVAIAGTVGIVFGLVPALQAPGAGEHDALRSAGRGSVGGSNRQVRHLLIVVEVALSTMLTAGAGLLVQSFVRLSRVDTGFRTDAVVAVDRIELPRSRAAISRSAPFFEQLLARLRETPGIDAAGATIGLPLDPRARFFVDDSTFSIARRALLPVGQRPTAALHVVSGDYFAAAAIPLKRGRWFDARDRGESPAVVVINEAMAKRYWPDEDPIGQVLTHDLTILPAQNATRRIVGIVGDVRHFGLERQPEPQMFIPHLQMPWPSMALVLRTSLPIARVNAIVRAQVHALDATVPVPSALPMDRVVADAIGQPRFRSWVVGLFAAAAVLLAMVGLYGMIAFSVQQRRRELALRLALGASSRHAIGIVMSSGLKLAGAGALIGAVGAVAAARFLSAMLFGVGPADPATLGFASAAILLVAAGACYLPARRILRIEPLRALSDGTD